MKLAFYYHIPILALEGNLHMPGFLGVFIDSLANNVDELHIVMHEAHGTQIKDCDYVLKQTNIKWINLGKRSPAWYRTFFPGQCLKHNLQAIEKCDAFIVRSPSPLAPHFYKFVKNPKIFFMIVGNYVDDAGHLKSSTWRNQIIYHYLHYYDKQFTSRIAQTDVLVNSPFLYDKYHKVAKSIYQIRTTTLTQNDFFYREDTCLEKPVHSLFTGRIDPAKGLTELVHALHTLRKANNEVILDIVGWEDAKDKPYQKELMDLATHLGVADLVVFHGKKQIGEELNAMYKMADVYVLPSYYEGFPRTIWEAMANSLPVIATRVGGIPDTLTNEENVLLIEPKDSQAIMDAIIRVTGDEILRRKLIVNGRQMAKGNTLEIQTNKMLDYVRKRLIITN